MIFFDFDGTIVDVWFRYYQVFLSAARITGVSLADYKEAKQTLLSDREVARHFGLALPDTYSTVKQKLLETERFLCLDSILLPPEKLIAFFSQHDCRLLTSRRRPNAFLSELKALGLGQLSDRAFILDPNSDINKRGFLAQYFSQGFHVIVGDSEAEWEAATLKNMHAILVRTGLRKPEDFLPANRCTIMSSVEEFIATYMEKDESQ